MSRNLWAKTWPTVIHRVLATPPKAYTLIPFVCWISPDFPVRLPSWLHKNHWPGGNVPWDETHSMWITNFLPKLKDKNAEVCQGETWWILEVDLFLCTLTQWLDILHKLLLVKLNQQKGDWASVKIHSHGHRSHFPPLKSKLLLEHPLPKKT